MGAELRRIPEIMITPMPAAATHTLSVLGCELGRRSRTWSTPAPRAAADDGSVEVECGRRDRDREHAEGGDEDRGVLRGEQHGDARRRHQDRTVGAGGRERHRDRQRHAQRQVDDRMGRGSPGSERGAERREGADRTDGEGLRPVGLCRTPSLPRRAVECAGSHRVISQGLGSEQ